MIEIDYLKRTESGLLRRQLLETEGGWALSHAEVASASPASLRGYAGGWALGSGKVYTTRKAAEANLARNGWTIAAEYRDPGQETRTLKNKSSAQKIAQGLARVEVWIDRSLRDRIVNEAKSQGISIAKLVAEWASSLGIEKK